MKQSRWQFSLRRIFALTTIVALVTGACFGAFGYLVQAIVLEIVAILAIWVPILLVVAITIAGTIHVFCLRAKLLRNIAARKVPKHES